MAVHSNHQPTPAFSSLRRIQLGHTEISDRSAPYVVAEIGVNHEGSMKRAKELIRLAKQGGANAAKFQSYKAETLASRNSPAYWDLKQEPTRSQYKLFKKYDSFERDHYRELATYCREIEIDFLSTPFDDEAVDFLEPLVPFYKVASADLTNIPLLRNIASRGKTVVLSTGASTLAEIDAAVDELLRNGCGGLVLLHCVLNYPTEEKHANLGMIRGLRRCYPEFVIGYSDHTLPDPEMELLTTAYLLGARVIEKHFTCDKTLTGNDHYHSMDCDDLRRFVQRTDRIRMLLGTSDVKRPLSSEALSRKNARRSIVLQQDVKAGTMLSEEDLTCKRPGSGISPLHWDEVIGRRCARALRKEHILQWEDLASGGR